MAFKCKKRINRNAKTVQAVNISSKQYGLGRSDGDVPVEEKKSGAKAPVFVL